MEKSYIDSIMLCDRLHKLFLAIIRKDLEDMGIEDITPVQALIVYNVGRQTLKVAHIQNHRLHAGTNISYNVRKLIARDYLMVCEQERDRRATYVSLSEKGLLFLKNLEALLEEHTKRLNEKGIVSEHFQEILGKGLGLEAAWQQSFF